jgi:hypothetical protein
MLAHRPKSNYNLAKRQRSRPLEYVFAFVHTEPLNREMPSYTGVSERGPVERMGEMVVAHLLLRLAQA